ncbi:hypothetical protein [Sphingomonas abietis]|uniref:Uncharacterized protein n=1 Tax=Sphingomonas abietis TaxID=3012344 RepID=A0ABY7NRZ9_9SPHN|nr:hypothetical protein [Sphingomonas abietis]WBO22739.1 hypothetical protein PBT88_00870 [Sphingomonas abietis]
MQALALIAILQGETSGRARRAIRARVSYFLQIFHELGPFARACLMAVTYVAPPHNMAWVWRRAPYNERDCRNLKG